MRDERGEIHNAQPAPAIGNAVAALAGRQYGVVSRAQLGELGLDRYAILRRVRNGSLHPLHARRVFSTTRARLPKRGQYLAAVMACGWQAALSHRSAADLWGLRPNSTRLEVTVPDGGGGARGVTAFRTRMRNPADFTVLDGIPVTSVARTLLDLAAVLRSEDLLAAIDRAERLRIFDLTAVVDVLDRARGRRGAGALRRAIATYEPSMQKSKLERRFKRLLETAPDIPSPSFNAIVDGENGAHEVDAHWPEQALAVQTDGFEFHRTRADRERDAASDADLELAGIRVIRFTWDDVTVHGERTLRRVRLAGGWAARRGT